MSRKVNPSQYLTRDFDAVVLLPDGELTLINLKDMWKQKESYSNPANPFYQAIEMKRIKKRESFYKWLVERIKNGQAKG